MAFFESIIPAQWGQSVIQAESTPFWVSSTLVLLICLGSFYLSLRYYHRIRMMADTPTSKIRSAAQGYIEMEGVGILQQDAEIYSSLTACPCLWYSYKIEKKVVSYDSKGRRRSRWQTIKKETSTLLFSVRDDTGTCIVDPEDAEVTPSSTQIWYSHHAGWHGLIPATNRFFSLSNKEYRLTESRIDINSELYLLGRFASITPNVGGTYAKEDLLLLLKEWKRDPRGLVARFDHNNDGKIDQQEWEAAVDIAKETITRQQSDIVKQAAIHIMGKPENSRRPFIISAIPQQQIIRRFAYYTIASAATFIISGGVYSWLMTTRFGM